MWTPGDMGHPQDMLRRARRERGRSSDEALGVAIGTSWVGPSGRVWTVRAVLRAGSRVLVVAPGQNGECAAVIDRGALARMVPVEDAVEEREVVAASP
jgi:hypothetical protein